MKGFLCDLQHSFSVDTSLHNDSELVESTVIFFRSVEKTDALLKYQCALQLEMLLLGMIHPLPSFKESKEDRRVSGED